MKNKKSLIGVGIIGTGALLGAYEYLKKKKEEPIKVNDEESRKVNYEDMHSVRVDIYDVRDALNKRIEGKRYILRDKEALGNNLKAEDELICNTLNNLLSDLGVLPDGYELDIEYDN